MRSEKLIADLTERVAALEGEDLTFLGHLSP